LQLCVAQRAVTEVRVGEIGVGEIDRVQLLAGQVVLGYGRPRACYIGKSEPSPYPSAPVTWRSSAMRAS
jgi:hypothetical protein